MTVELLKLICSKLATISLSLFMIKTIRYFEIASNIFYGLYIK